MTRNVMPVQCSGCAYREGTEANRDELTQVTAALCVQAGDPFFCHANAIADKLPKGQERVCVGHVEAMARRGDVPTWKEAVAREALQIMEEAADGILAPDEEVAGRLLLAGHLAEKRRLAL